MRVPVVPRSLYLAGPDVFRQDAAAWAEEARTQCKRHGFEPLTPLDHGETGPEDIYRANIELMRRADAVVAHLDPFRGSEPDSGTCIEVGYALALNKPVWAYLSRQESLRERVNRLEHADPGRTHDNEGMQIEDFGLPLNLMIAVPVRIIHGDMAACLMAIREETAGQAGSAPQLPENPLIRIAVESAVRYLRWVEHGRIADAQSIATVAEHYKVEAAMVRGWLKDWAGIRLAETDGYLPDDVVRQMKISGRQFRRYR